MKTRIPKVALRVSRFITSALTGRTTEPVARKRSTNVPIAITSSAKGKCQRRLWSSSSNSAPRPPTFVGNAGPEQRDRCARRDRAGPAHAAVREPVPEAARLHPGRPFGGETPPRGRQRVHARSEPGEDRGQDDERDDRREEGHRDPADSH